MDLKVLHGETQEDGSIRYAMRLPRGAGRVSGFDALVQRVLLVWMGTPGRDVTEPSAGGGLAAAFRRAQETRDFGDLAAQVALTVTRTEQQLLVEQAGRSRPAAERLDVFRLLSVEHTDNRIRVSVALRAADGIERVLTL